MTTTTKSELIRGYLKDHPKASQKDVAKALKLEVASSEVSAARKALGLSVSRKKPTGPITCEELDHADQLVACLGVSVKEAFETVEVVHSYLQDVGDFDRAKEALEKLKRYAGGPR